VTSNRTNRPTPDTHADAPRLAIVVGAHPAAEISDRPIAAGLAAALAAEWEKATGVSPTPGQILTVSDLWYVNDGMLRALPTVAVGPPEHNAFTAYLADKIPSVHVVDGVLIVQAELSFASPLAACWGVDPGSTRRAAEVFLTKLGEIFIGHAAGLPA
jgi:hypothetical protein